jgi:hypothetical protein
VFFFFHLSFEKENYIARLWKSEILNLLGRDEEAAIEQGEANRLLEEFENATRMEMGKAVPETTVEVDSLTVKKGGKEKTHNGLLSFGLRHD